MIDLYYAPTPNGWKITIMLEECSIPYSVIPVDLGKGDQFKPDFLKISPNNRMPAIVDHEGPIMSNPLRYLPLTFRLRVVSERFGNDKRLI